MSYIEVFLIGIGLSMDAFAVCATNAVVYKNTDKKRGLIMAVCFGVFQAVMPTIGYFLGSAFSDYIKALDHIIALILLAFIGVKMIIDAFKGESENSVGQKITFPMIIVQGIATSIDALAVGISFAALQSIRIFPAVALIGLTTFVLCVIALIVGKRFGKLLNNKAQLVGGLILISIGIKIFVEHTFFGG